jgi:hypothetical protein
LLTFLPVSEQMFSTGSILYVNRQQPAPIPPPDDAPASELLKFDRENLWVGRVLECRADSERDVFLRIFWLYWPEELPMGRQPYHGEKELVMSNAMDIIDAQSIASAAEVSYWDEKDEEGDSDLGERFWRQTFDVNKLGKANKGGLSDVRRHCTCQREYNPDLTMYKCVDENCGIWNHEECLVENVCARAYEKSLTGSLHGDGKKVNGESAAGDVVHQAPAKSPNKRFFSAGSFGDLLNAATAKARDIMTPTPDPVGEDKDTVREKIAGHFPWKVPPPGAPREWRGKFVVSIENEDVVEGKGKVTAKVETKKIGRKESIQWTEEVCCLKCGTLLE